MKLELTALGNVKPDGPKVLYRVEHWRSGRHIADFTCPAEASKCAIETGDRFDNKVSRVVMVS